MNETILNEFAMKFQRNPVLSLDEKNAAILRGIFKPKSIRKDDSFLQGGKLLANSSSCYSHFYEANVNYRKIQKRTPVNEAAATIAKIIAKKELKPRYKIAVPFMFRLIIHLPDSLKERIMRKR